MTSTGRLLIFGTGAHARKVAHYARRLGWIVAGFVDEAPSASAPIPSLPVHELSAIGFPGELADAIFVAIGAPAPRRRLLGLLQSQGWPLPALVHPGAWVAPDAVLEDGVLVAAGAVVETGAMIGLGAIIDVGVVLDHDVRVGAMAHLRAGEIRGPCSEVNSPENPD